MIAFWKKKGGILVKSGGILVIQWERFGKKWGVLTCIHPSYSAHYQNASTFFKSL